MLTSAIRHPFHHHEVMVEFVSVAEVDSCFFIQNLNFFKEKKPPPTLRYEVLLTASEDHLHLGHSQFAVLGSYTQITAKHKCSENAENDQYNDDPKRYGI